jgi:hypothetical protein
MHGNKVQQSKRQVKNSVEVREFKLFQKKILYKICATEIAYMIHEQINYIFFRYRILISNK